ncbi:class I SAM-dependent methyltransferase [Polaribacter sp. SA4-12]|uniref:class I SAM-dependent methyltransferase n=1 Tax=Polaribacter sp. SA4-12 TaxID=1312072 RepID=UPI000B3C3102|nr:class I SAM-dependent methyltransferase [Polaribacter sp. SA4-12]ARV15745.1 methyltransferase [Polaribacter sp. SA4-12]
MGRKRELHKGLEPFLNCKDYTVSGETYEVMFNPDYDMLITSPVPVDLENYYKSEDYISHTDSKKSMLDKVYQSVKNYTLKRKLSLINSFDTESKNILDVGAGTGDFLKICAANNWNVLGVEPSSDARNIAKEKGVVLKEDLLEIENQKFDVITLWHVLEHVEMLSDYISKLKELLSDNGRLVIAVPNHKSYDAKYYKEFWAAFDVPRHLWHFSQTSIHKIFSTEEMIVEKTIPMKFDSYYVSLLSEKYKTGKMNPVKALYRGFTSNLKARTSSEYSSLIYVIKKH